MKPTSEQDDARVKEIQDELNKMQKSVDSGYKMVAKDYDTISNLFEELTEINRRTEAYIDEQVAGVMGKSQRETNPVSYWFWRSWIALKMYGTNWLKLFLVSFITLTISVPLLKLAYNYIKILWAIW